VKINDSSSSISISYQSRGVIPTASDVYNPNDLYWLSRVIFAESGTQPFEGMIGVGNVVLNRVESIRFPDSVYDVIFQKNQFSVVDCGMIYREPDERSIIAAKLCLEGADSAGESLYFINPALCNGSWFRNNLTFTERIGEHDFFM
jgi:N-acetylmuramoyl-L-alanine amidase